MSSKILVIDDETCILKMMSLVLEGAGYETVTASGGAAALELYGNGAQFDLVITDYHMPDVNGVQVLSEITRRDPSARVLMISGVGGIDAALESINMGAIDFLRKPFSPEALRDAVRVAIERDQKVSPVNSVCREFSKKCTGDTNFELKSRTVDSQFGDITCTFDVVSPKGTRTVSVVLPSYVQELVLAYIDSETVPCGGRFYDALCEVALYNTIRESGIPSIPIVRVEELDKSLRTWIDSMIQVPVAL